MDRYLEGIFGEGVVCPNRGNKISVQFGNGTGDVFASVYFFKLRLQYYVNITKHEATCTFPFKEPQMVQQSSVCLLSGL